MLFGFDLGFWLQTVIDGCLLFLVGCLVVHVFFDGVLFLLGFTCTSCVLGMVQLCCYLLVF